MTANGGSKLPHLAGEAESSAQKTEDLALIFSTRRLASTFPTKCHKSLASNEAAVETCSSEEARSLTKIFEIKWVRFPLLSYP